MNFQALEYALREMVASIMLNRPERMNAWTAVLACARPPFAMARLRKEGGDLLYRCVKQHSEPATDKRGAKVDKLHLTPLDPIDRIAALAPRPRK